VLNSRKTNRKQKQPKGGSGRQRAAAGGSRRQRRRSASRGLKSELCEVEKGKREMGLCKTEGGGVLRGARSALDDSKRALQKRAAVEQPRSKHKAQEFARWQSRNKRRESRVTKA
jgi:hypothetical protein